MAQAKATIWVAWSWELYEGWVEIARGEYGAVIGEARARCPEINAKVVVLREGELPELLDVPERKKNRR